jgi:hypothetical protein
MFYVLLLRMSEQYTSPSRAKRLSAREYQLYMEQLRTAYAGIKKRQKAMKTLEQKEKKQADQELQHHLSTL